jgi:hypothetical protein
MRKLDMIAKDAALFVKERVLYLVETSAKVSASAREDKQLALA